MTLEMISLDHLKNQNDLIVSVQTFLKGEEILPYVQTYLGLFSDFLSNRTGRDVLEADFTALKHEADPRVHQQMERVHVFLTSHLLYILEGKYPGFTDHFKEEEAGLQNVSGFIDPQLLKRTSQEIRDFNGYISSCIQGALEKTELTLYSRLLPSLYNKPTFNGLSQWAVAETVRVNRDREKRGLSELSSVCLIFFDLNGFKAINDLFGHDVGDAVLKRFESILHRVFRREADILGHDSGDEFRILLPAIDRAACEKLLAALKREIKDDPFEVASATGDVMRFDEGSPFHPSISGGYLLRVPSSETSIPEWTSQADFASQASKVYAQLGETLFSDYDDIRCQSEEIDRLAKARSARRNGGH